MKPTILTTLALGLIASISGVIFKVLHLSDGNSLLMGGIFLTLIGSALLALQWGEKAHQEGDPLT